MKKVSAVPKEDRFSGFASIRKHPMWSVGVALLAIGAVALGSRLSLHKQPILTKRIYIAPPSQVVPTTSSSIIKSSTGTSSICVDTSASKLSDVLGFGIDNATTIIPNSQDAAGIISGCSYTVENWQHEPVRSITVFSNTFSEPQAAVSYLTTLVKHTKNVTSEAGVADAAEFLQDANQLIEREGNTIYTITASKSQPSSQGTQKILITIGKTVQ